MIESCDLHCQPRYAVTTGASRGLGKAIAMKATRRGYRPILVDSPGTGLPLVGESLRRLYGREIHVFEVDLSHPPEPAEFAEWLIRCGPPSSCS